MSTVTLDSVITVYANIDEADAYLDGAVHADTWRALTDDDTKARYLVTATRILDRQTWKDEYNTFALRSVVTDIVNASIELALALADGSDVQNQQTTAERIRSFSAGSVSITNAWVNDTDAPTRFPLIVQELLLPYLGGSGDSGDFGMAKATGVDAETIFPIELGHTGGM